MRIGTTSYIDSLNPFNYIESQAYNGDDHDLPAARAVRRRRCEFEGDWAESWETSEDGKDWTFTLRPDTKWSDGEPMTAADAAWTINTTVKYADGADGRRRVRARARQERRGDRRHDARDPLRRRRSGTCSPQLEQFFILPEHVWAPKAGAERQGPEDVPARSSTCPIVSGGAYTITQYEKKGTTAFKPYPDFYGPPSNADGRRAHVLHELRRDDRRSPGTATSTGSTRCRSRPSTPSRRPRTSSSTSGPGRRDDQHHLELEPAPRRRTASSSTRR